MNRLLSSVDPSWTMVQLDQNIQLFIHGLSQPMIKINYQCWSLWSLVCLCQLQAVDIGWELLHLATYPKVSLLLMCLMRQYLSMLTCLHFTYEILTTTMLSWSSRKLRRTSFWCRWGDSGNTWSWYQNKWLWNVEWRWKMYAKYMRDRGQLC